MTSNMQSFPETLVRPSPTIALQPHSLRSSQETTSSTSLPPALASTRKHTFPTSFLSSIDVDSVIIVTASFTIIFTCCGFNFAFGIYQAYFESMSKLPGNPFSGSSPALIDLIGTIAIGLMTAAAPLAVTWAKRFSPRKVSFIGSVILSLGLILASFGQKLWHFELTQGVLVGIGTCMPYMAAVTVAPSWFTTHRGLALGIILSGTGIGGLVWAPVLQVCIDKIGFRNTLRMSGGVSFALLSVACTAMRWEPSAKARIDLENSVTQLSFLGKIFNVPLVNLRVAKSRRFLAHAAGAAFQSAVYYTPVFFLSAYASTLGYSASTGANFIAISNACNAIGKVAIGYLADRTGRLNALAVSTIVSAIAVVGLWLPSSLLENSQSRNLFVAFVVLYGSFSSAYVSLFPASLVELFGIQNFASVNGFLYMIRGMATLLGTPLSGLLIKNGSSNFSGQKSYVDMSIFISVLLFCATACVLWVRVEAMSGSNIEGHSKWRM